MAKKTGLMLIADERARQIAVEGWTPEHDDDHDDDELASAAACYAAPEKIYTLDDHNSKFEFSDPWPRHWDEQWDKRGKGTRIRRLVKAGALIAAEIDRLVRAGKKR